MKKLLFVLLFFTLVSIGQNVSKDKEQLKLIVKRMMEAGYGEDNIKEVIEAWEAGVRPSKKKLVSNSGDGQEQIEWICSNYNSKAPIRIDAETTLTGVNCNKGFFSYTYRLDESVLERYGKVELKTNMANNISSFVNSNSEHLIIRKSNRNLGFVYNDFENNLLFLIFYSVDKSSGSYVRNLNLEKRIMELY